MLIRRSRFFRAGLAGNQLEAFRRVDVFHLPPATVELADGIMQRRDRLAIESKQLRIGIDSRHAKAEPSDANIVTLADAETRRGFSREMNNLALKFGESEHGLNRHNPITIADGDLI